DSFICTPGSGVAGLFYDVYNFVSIMSERVCKKINFLVKFVFNNMFAADNFLSQFGGAVNVRQVRMRFSMPANSHSILIHKPNLIPSQEVIMIDCIGIDKERCRI